MDPRDAEGRWILPPPVTHPAPTPVTLELSAEERVALSSLLATVRNKGRKSPHWAGIAERLADVARRLL